MNFQDLFNSIQDYDAIEPSPEPHYLESENIEAVADAVETQPVPVNILLDASSNNEQFLLPPAKDVQETEPVCVYVDSIDTSNDQNVYLLSSNGNVLTVPSNSLLLTTQTIKISDSTPSTSGMCTTESVNLQDFSSCAVPVTLESENVQEECVIQDSGAVISPPDSVDVQDSCMYLITTSESINEQDSSLCAIPTSESDVQNTNTCLVTISEPMDIQDTSKSDSESTSVQNTSPTESVNEHDTGKSLRSKSNSIYVDDIVKDSELPTRDRNFIGKRKSGKFKGFVHLPDRTVVPRAIASLPAALHLRRKVVSPKRPLPERVRFGPVQGVEKALSRSEARKIIRDAASSKTPIFLIKTGVTIKIIDVSDQDKSNWFSLVPLGTQSTANVWLYEEDSTLYGVTIKSVPSNTPLALGYTKRYQREHKLPPGLPVIDLSQDFPDLPRRWWCYECHKAMPTASLLQLHVDIYHKEKLTSTRRYRCRYCTNSFGRISTLRRHVARYCLTKLEITEMKNKKSTPPKELNTSSNDEDESYDEDDRLPSDESLQNYTNSLDFSTNLFDTDQMPGLDISGSSKSDKDDTGLDLEVEKLPKDTDKTATVEQDKSSSPPKQPLRDSISCPYCKQTILREKKREHLKQCPGKKFECHCGKIFKSKWKLGRHLQTSGHDNSAQSVSNVVSTRRPDDEQSNGMEYNCENCEHTFKRRGMYVNHMWRVHKTRSSVPLQRRVRHYPCGACPKLYGTAAKRDTHRALHHPDVVLVRGLSIESGRKACEPAVCQACPCQYATRAKLMQHVRKKHPELAPPSKKDQKSKSQERDEVAKSTPQEEDIDIANLLK